VTTVKNVTIPKMVQGNRSPGTVWHKTRPTGKKRSNRRRGKQGNEKTWSKDLGLEGWGEPLYPHCNCQKGGADPDTSKPSPTKKSIHWSKEWEKKTLEALCEPEGEKTDNEAGAGKKINLIQKKGGFPRRRWHS